MVTTERPRIENSVPTTPQGIGAIIGTSYALASTSVIGGFALLLNLVWPWLAWGYVAVGLVAGSPAAVMATRGAIARLRDQSRR
jgi:hypothetical protein